MDVKNNFFLLFALFCEASGLELKYFLSRFMNLTNKIFLRVKNMDQTAKFLNRDRIVEYRYSCTLDIDIQRRLF